MTDAGKGDQRRLSSVEDLFSSERATAIDAAAAVGAWAKRNQSQPEETATILAMLGLDSFDFVARPLRNAGTARLVRA